MSMSTPQAVKLAEFSGKDKERPTIYSDHLEEIVSSIRDIPTTVVSIGGITKSGKSFLLNLFVNYLDYLVQNGSNANWENSNTSVEGINWAQSRKSVTVGIWMWNRPFIITRKDGTKMAVLLVDSQGTRDIGRSHEQLDALIMYMCLQISSVLLLNVEKRLTSSDMIGLRLCSSFVDIPKPHNQDRDNGDYLFPSLVFVIRDYQSGSEFGEDPTLFQEVIEGLDNDELEKVVLGIDAAFKQKTAFNFPYPGDEIAKASSNGDRRWELQDVPLNFRLVAKSLIQKLCRVTEVTDGQKVWSTANLLLKNFQMLKSHLESDDLPQFIKSEDMLREIMLHHAFVTAELYCNEESSKLCGVDQLEQILTSMQLRETFDRIAHRSNEIFEDLGRKQEYGRSASFVRYQSSLEHVYNAAFTKLQTYQQIQADKKESESNHAAEKERLEELLAEANKFDYKKVVLQTVATVATQALIGFCFGGPVGAAAGAATGAATGAAPAAAAPAARAGLRVVKYISIWVVKRVVKTPL